MFSKLQLARRDQSQHCFGLLGDKGNSVSLYYLINKCKTCFTRKLCDSVWVDVIMHVLAWTAITKYHWLTSNRNLFLLGAGPGSLRSGCQHPPLDCTLLTSHCILTWQRAEQGRKLSYDSYKGTNSVYEGCILMTSSDPNYLPRTLLLIPSHWGIEFQHLSFGGKKNIQSIKLHVRRRKF